MRILHLMAFGLAAVLAGCRGPGVTPGELVGTWRMAAESRRQLGTACAAADSGLSFRDGGTFSASQLPQGFFDVDPGLDASVASGDGRWSIKEERAGPYVQLLFDDVRGMRGRPAVPYGDRLEIARARDRLDLFFFRGDPDQGERVVFERTARE